MEIDVEGHELTVLKGCHNPIKNNRPVFIVEAEERHKKGTVSELREFFIKESYDGFFIRDELLVEMNEFDTSLYQKRSNLGDWTKGWKIRGVYINNFLFFPSEELQAIQEKITRIDEVDIKISPRN